MRALVQVDGAIANVGSTLVAQGCGLNVGGVRAKSGSRSLSSSASPPHERLTGDLHTIRLLHRAIQADDSPEVHEARRDSDWNLALVVENVVLDVLLLHGVFAELVIPA